MNSGIVSSNTKLKTVVKIVSRYNGELCAFYIKKSDDRYYICMYTSQNYGMDFNDERNIYELDGEIGDWMGIECTIDSNGDFQFFLLNDGNTFKDPILKQRGEAERIKLNELNRLKINLWHCKCSADFKNMTIPKMIWEGYTGALNSCIALKNGRIILPFSFRTDRTWYNRGNEVSHFSFYGQYNSTVIYSDDLGETFKLANNLFVTVPDIVSSYGAVEPVCIEKTDGGVLMLIRTQLGIFYESTSSDGSEFTVPVPSKIVSSDSPAGVVRIGNALVLFHNACVRYPYAHGGRHVLHASISMDDFKSVKGIREVASDPYNYAPPPAGGDYGTAYPYPCAMKNGKVIFSTGQGKGRALLKILDPDWLLEKRLTSDFSKDAMQWHYFGTENINVSLDKVTIFPDKNLNNAVVWNFPAIINGSLKLKIKVSGTLSTVQLLITDNFSTPFDDNDVMNCVFDIRLPVESAGEYFTDIKFNCNTGICKVYINKLFISRLRARRLPYFGVNYLRVKTPVFSDPEGLLELHYASVKGK